MGKSPRDRRWGLLGIAAAAALLLSACSSTGPATEPAGAPAETGSTASSPSSQPPEESAATDTTGAESSSEQPSATDGSAARESTSDAAGDPLAFDQALFDMLPSEIQQSKTIKVANPFTAPWVFLDEDGKTLTGPAPDIAAAIGPMLGVEFAWTDAPFADLLPGIQSGKFDVGFGSITDTRERQKLFTFVDYAANPGAFFVLKDNPKHITGIDDSLCGLKASSLPGSVQLAALEAQSEKCAAEGKSAVETAAYAGTPEALLAIRSEKTDAYLGTLTSVVHNIRAGGLSDVLGSVGPIESGELSGMAIVKDRTGLAEAIQGAVQKLVTSGTYAEILKKYGYESVALDSSEITINGATN